MIRQHTASSSATLTDLFVLPWGRKRSLETDPRGDDHRLEPLENRLDGDGRVHAAVEEQGRDMKGHNRHSDPRGGLRSSVCVLHLKCSTGLAIVGVLSSKGSMMMVKPSASKTHFKIKKLNQTRVQRSELRERECSKTAAL